MGDIPRTERAVHQFVDNQRMRFINGTKMENARPIYSHWRTRAKRAAIGRVHLRTRARSLAQLGLVYRLSRAFDP